MLRAHEARTKEEAMDPNVVLAEIRDLIADMSAADWDDERVSYLMNKVNDLDTWLTRGGVPPEEWSRGSLDRAHKRGDYGSVEG